MRTRDVMNKTGLTKKAIHYYIQEQLIYPTSSDNGYYKFSDKDIDTLKAISKMRQLDFSVEDIRSILEHPEMMGFLMTKQQKYLRQKKAALEWQTVCLNELTFALGGTRSRELLFQKLEGQVSSIQSLDKESLIDLIDAEVLANYFWGCFIDDQAMTEYQRFLWERLKKTIIQNQTEKICKLCNTILTFNHNEISDVVYPYKQIFEAVAGLDESDYPAYVDGMISKVKIFLNNKVLVQDWCERYDTFYEPCSDFFDGAPAEIMREFSPTFNRYQKNVNRCCAMLIAYLDSDSGKGLKEELYARLGQHIDIYAYHGGELAGLIHRVDYYLSTASSLNCNK